MKTLISILSLGLLALLSGCSNPASSASSRAYAYLAFEDGTIRCYTVEDGQLRATESAVDLGAAPTRLAVNDTKTTALACAQLGVDFMGFELAKDYYEYALDRAKAACNPEPQLDL